MRFSRFGGSSALLHMVDNHPVALAALGGTFAVFCLGLWILRSAEDAQTDSPSELQDRALKGHPESALRLGWIYAHGEGVTRSYEHAARWWRVAAEAGNSSAQYNLGRLFAKRQGVTQDLAVAAAWYGAAAEQGNARAQCELALLCDLGQGVAQDYALAAAWYNKAAEQGDAKAQAHLAKLWYRGCGVEQNIAEAFVWVCLAASNNPKYASLRDKLLNELTPEQKAAADARLSSFPRKEVV